MSNEIEIGVKVNGPWWVSAVYWSQVAWRVALAGFLCVASGLLCVVAWQVYSLRKLPDWAEVQITRESNNTRAAALDAITGTRKELLGEVANLRKDVMTRVDDGLNKANQNLTDIRTDANTQITALSGMVNARLTDVTGKLDGQLARTNDSLAMVTTGLKPVLDHTASITKQVDDTAPLYLDCEYNPDCAFNRFQGTSKAVEHAAMNFGLMSNDFRAALPPAINTWQSIGTNVNGITANINTLTKPKWYDRLLGYGFTGVAIYRNLNPATNIVTGITRVITTQK